MAGTSVVRRAGPFIGSMGIVVGGLGANRETRMTKTSSL